jgi:hypothetical protein
MDKIYGGALVTFCASSSPDAHQGLVPSSGRTYTPHGYAPHIVQEPLNRRAWALQERILSPRIVPSVRVKLFGDVTMATISRTATNTSPINMAAAFYLVQNTRNDYPQYPPLKSSMPLSKTILHDSSPSAAIGSVHLLELQSCMRGGLVRDTLPGCGRTIYIMA